jgi:hypothetical protein
MNYDTLDDTADNDIWSEIHDSQAEIFDIPELQDPKDFNLESYLKSNIDY